jgi:hypothetical protein
VGRRRRLLLLLLLLVVLVLLLRRARILQRCHRQLRETMAATLAYQRRR